MCVAIAKPAGTTIFKRTLKAAFNTNSDGAGYAFVKDGTIQVNKGFFTFRKFYRTFRADERANPEANFLIHCRIATSGLLDAENCHPFYVNDELVVAHNGIFSGLGTTYISDTRVFLYQVLQRLPRTFLDRTDILNALESYIKVSGSKLVFLDNKGEFTICNQESGHWKDGIWFSNLHHDWAGGWYDWRTGSTSQTEFDNYCETTYRQCGVCDIKFPLSQLDWDKVYQYWICEDCAEKEHWRHEDFCDAMEGIDDSSESLTYHPDSRWRNECDVCGYPETTIHIQNTNYCEQCWNSVIEYYTSVCPHCQMNTTFSFEVSSGCYSCYCCGSVLSEDEFLDLFEHDLREVN